MIGSRLGRTRRNRGPGLAATATVLGVLLVGYVYYEHRTGESAAVLRLEPDPHEVAGRPLPDGGLGADAGELAVHAGPARTIEGTLGKDERFIDVLDSLALAREETFSAIHAMEKVFSFRNAQPGTEYAVELASDGTLVGFRVRRSPLEVYEVRREGRGFTGRRVDVVVRRVLVDVGSEVQTSLWQAVKDAHEESSLLGRLVAVFEWDIDFNSQTREGDRFAVVIEKVYVEEQFVEYGDLIAAAYEGTVAGSWRVVRWEDPTGDVGYYSPDGRSVKKIFLKSPLRFTRISSGYSESRFHPILQRNRAHLGVDYAAPTGTPVRAIGDGYVIFAGYKGGNGKLVVLGHANGIRSHYGHLSVIRRGVQYAGRVKQGELIGRVGATGLATGPHLHYGLTRKGYFVSPLEFEPPPDKEVPRDQQAAFAGATTPLLARLEVSLRKIVDGSDWR